MFEDHKQNQDAQTHASLGLGRMGSWVAQKTKASLAVCQCPQLLWESWWNEARRKSESHQATLMPPHFPLTVEPRLLS